MSCNDQEIRFNEKRKRKETKKKTRLKAKKRQKQKTRKSKKQGIRKAKGYSKHQVGFMIESFVIVQTRNQRLCLLGSVVDSWDQSINHWNQLFELLDLSGEGWTPALGFRDLLVTEI